jgi:hypothetical protein
MGMFDWYKSAAKLVCPACGHALTEWQGKDGPCGLFVWVEGRASPEDERVDDDCALSGEERGQLRLPERFVIYSHDCARHTVEASCRCVEGTWVESTVSGPSPNGRPTR